MRIHIFQFDKQAKFEYIPALNEKIKFLSRTSDKEQIVQKYNEMFKVEDLYTYHTNVAENIIEKNKVKFKKERSI